MKKNRLPKLALCLAFALVMPLPSRAEGKTVRSISTSQATGANAELQTVHVWAGHGVSISFYPTQEIIKKVWLDDPSQIVFDVDGCLEGLGDSECSNPGAGLIHLRRINKLKIPQMPAANYGAHLTVITETGRERKNYHFRIVMGSGKPQYSAIQIVPAPPKSTPHQVNASVTKTAATITQGMQVALQRQWIQTTDSLWQRLANLITELQGGVELRAAAQTAGVSMALVNRLLELGTSSPHLVPIPHSESLSTTSSNFKEAGNANPP